jgi:hypothetical protein
MFLAIENHFNKRSAIWNTNVPITEVKNVFTDLLKSLTKKFEIQLTNNTGVAIDKKNLRKSIEYQAYIISSGASVYALHTNNGDLYTKVYFLKSHFRMFRDGELQSNCTNLVTNVSTVLQSVYTYGITPEMINNLTADIEKFALIQKLPLEKKKQKANATKAINQLIETISTLLNTEMDPLMVVFAKAEPDFVALYTNLRSIKKIGVTKLKLITKVIDASTNESIVGVMLKVNGTKIKRISSYRGQNTITNISEGEYEIKTFHKDYKPLAVKFIVVHGETTKLVLPLEHIDASPKHLPFFKR